MNSESVGHAAGDGDFEDLNVKMQPNESKTGGREKVSLVSKKVKSEKGIDFVRSL